MRRSHEAFPGFRKRNSKLLLLAILLGTILSIIIGLMLYALNRQGRI